MVRFVISRDVVSANHRYDRSRCKHTRSSQVSLPCALVTGVPRHMLIMWCLLYQGSSCDFPGPFFVRLDCCRMLLATPHVRLRKPLLLILTTCCFCTALSHQGPNGRTEFSRRKIDRENHSVQGNFCPQRSRDLARLHFGDGPWVLRSEGGNSRSSH